MGLFGQKIRTSESSTLPLLVIEDLVCFPLSLIPLYVQSKPGMAAVDKAMASDRRILVAYKKTNPGSAGTQELQNLASLCRITQVMRLPNSTSRVLVEAEARVQIDGIGDQPDQPSAGWLPLELDNSISPDISQWMRSLQEAFRVYASFHKKIPSEASSNIEHADAPHRLVDLVVTNVSMSLERKMAIFLLTDTIERLSETVIATETESRFLELKADIHGRVKKRMEQSQKEYFINEQIKELNRELGKEEDDNTAIRDLEQKIKDLPLSEDARVRVGAEFKRLQRLAPLSPEAGIVRTWLELIVELPWTQPSEGLPDLVAAQNSLDRDHYDLEDAKDRILDYLAARAANPAIHAPILCFAGPPGTGKTSLGRSIARALGRSFVRISLGGVRDEAEVRGHRRTYVGAMPGKIIQGMRKAKTTNPVFLLDEIDKLSSDHRGDPSAALLEVLDPEQNASFADHYLEITYDLSHVLFIATANNLANIPWPLRDRMDIIEVPGYTPYEKKKIAHGFLIPKQLGEHKLASGTIEFSDASLDTIIETYTHESGVRQLERSIAKIVRKSIRERLPELVTLQKSQEPEREESSSIRDEALLSTSGPAAEKTKKHKAKDGTPASEKDFAVSRDPERSVAQLPPFHALVDEETVNRYLKRPRIHQDLITEDLPPGFCYGLAWTETGGTVMPVEVVLGQGKGELILTGSLGDVMKESARIALSVVRARELAGPETKYLEKDIHIHVPEGAIPKDGPSAGITLTTALVSALTLRPVKARIAMTGEITLTGRVLPIGGVREKLLAAHRLGIRTVILPEKNKIDLRDLPGEITDHLELIWVKTIDDVLKHALEPST